jgi:AcrR family transcriptional regulator
MQALAGAAIQVAMTGDEDERRTLRAEQVAQTRGALLAAGRRLFGTRGFAATSVEELARDARVTTGALYHHFPKKAALFEAVFEEMHGELLQAAEEAGSGAADEMAFLSRGFEAFLDAFIRPDVQRILITDAPAVLGLVRFTELDERHAFPVLADTLRAVAAAGRLRVAEPETLARLLLGALTRAAMLIASSPTPAVTRDEVTITVRDMLAALAR